MLKIIRHFGFTLFGAVGIFGALPFLSVKQKSAAEVTSTTWELKTLPSQAELDSVC